MCSVVFPLSISLAPFFVPNPCWQIPLQSQNPKSFFVHIDFILIFPLSCNHFVLKQHHHRQQHQQQQRSLSFHSLQFVSRARFGTPTSLPSFPPLRFSTIAATVVVDEAEEEAEEEEEDESDATRRSLSLSFSFSFSPSFSLLRLFLLRSFLRFASSLSSFVNM